MTAVAFESSIGEPRSLHQIAAELAARLPVVCSPIRMSGVYLADESGRLRWIAGNDNRTLLSRLCQRTVLAGADDLGSPMLLPAPSLGPSGPIASAPIAARGAVYGLVAVERAPQQPEFGRTDLEALICVASRLADLLERWAELERQAVGAPESAPGPVAGISHSAAMAPVPAPVDPGPRAEAGRVKRDLTIASDVQRRLLPDLPSIFVGESARLHVSALYRPAFEVGGDFYDLAVVGPDRYLAIVGDVSGKGVSAALLMVQALTEFRSIARLSSSPSTILGAMNTAMAASCCDEAFITAACVAIDLSERRAVLASAGHVPALIRRLPDEVVVLDSATGVPLGLAEDEFYQEHSFPLDSSDTLILMTDGITEALDRIPEPTTDSNLVGRITSGPQNVHDLVSELASAADTFCTDHRDDIAVLGFHIDGYLQ